MYSFLFVLGVLTITSYAYSYLERKKESNNKGTVIVPTHEYEEYLKWRNANFDKNPNVRYSSTDTIFGKSGYGRDRLR